MVDFWILPKKKKARNRGEQFCEVNFVREVYFDLG